MNRREMKSAPARSPRLGRRVVVLGVAAVLVVAAVVAVLLARGGSDRPGPTAASSRTASSSSAGSFSIPPPLPTPTPSGPTANATDAPSALPVVQLTAAASESNGLVATVPHIQGIQGRGNGPGNVAGPAVRVTVRLRNGTGAPIALGGVAVNMYYGTERVPASPLDDPSEQPFGGMLAVGSSADGVYVFSVPADARGVVTVEVGYQAGAPLLEFTGSVR